MLAIVDTAPQSSGMAAWVAAGEGFKVYPEAATHTPPAARRSEQGA
jgi:hypothetical protein